MEVYLFDQWYDWWRLAVLVVSSLCILTLIVRFIQFRKNWNTFEIDAWFAMMMWCAAAWQMQADGLIRDAAFRGRLVFVTAAVLLTSKLLWQNKGSWGKPDDD